MLDHYPLRYEPLRISLYPCLARLVYAHSSAGQSRVKRVIGRLDLFLRKKGGREAGGQLE